MPLSLLFRRYTPTPVPVTTHTTSDSFQTQTTHITQHKRKHKRCNFCIVCISLPTIVVRNMRRPQQPLRYYNSQKHRTDKNNNNNNNPLEGLPDDLVVFILSKLSSTASYPSDFINILLT